MGVPVALGRVVLGPVALTERLRVLAARPGNSRRCGWWWHGCAGGGAAGGGTSAAGGLGGGAAGGTSSASRASGQNNSRLADVAPGPAGSEQAGTARVPSEIPCADRLAATAGVSRLFATTRSMVEGVGRTSCHSARRWCCEAARDRRTEVSNADYAAYCSRTGTHAARRRARISRDRNLNRGRRAYVGWLSQVTGAVYRLPTDGEWTYAVTAQGGSTDVNSVNCLVEIGGKKVRGVALEPVQSGSPNGWGLYNTLATPRSGSCRMARCSLKAAHSVTTCHRVRRTRNVRTRMRVIR